jgi:galactose-1-phosphate uridylyltransferase
MDFPPLPKASAERPTSDTSPTDMTNPLTTTHGNGLASSQLISSASNTPDSDGVILKALTVLHTKIDNISTKVDKMNKIQSERNIKIRQLLSQARDNASTLESSVRAHEQLAAELLEKVMGDPSDFSKFVYSLLDPAHKRSLPKAPPLSAELAAALECLKPIDINSI